MKDEFSEAVTAGGSSNTWKPEKDATLIGTLKSKKSNQGPNESMVYVIKADDQEEDVSVWGSTVLDGHFEEIPLRSRVKITYLGKVKSDRGRGEYKDYTVLYIPPKDAATDVFPDGEPVEN